MTNTVSKILCITGMLVALSACTKIRAKKLEGTYIGLFNVSSWTLGNEPSDSTGSVTINVTRDGENLVLFGWAVPVKELKNGAEYEEGTSNNQSILFKNGMMSYHQETIAGGGGGSYTFHGEKVD